MMIRNSGESAHIHESGQQSASHVHEPAARHVHGEAPANLSSCQEHENSGEGDSVLTIRSHSGLSGDMILAGLTVLNLELRQLEPESPEGRGWLENILNRIMPGLGAAAAVEQSHAGAIHGWRLKVDLQEEKTHRNIDDIKKIVAQSGLGEWATGRAEACFKLLAECEAAAHGIAIKEVHFHEVGALDSILDICGACALMEELGRPKLICGPLPVADGQICCAHGILPAPAPAVLRLLRGVPVKPFAGEINAGELVTPTALAILKAFSACFGPWPAFRMEYEALVYGRRIFKNAPNGVIFALGECCRADRVIA